MIVTILVIIVVFVVLGLSGWLLQILGHIANFLLNGIRGGCGCIFTAFAILLGLWVVLQLLF